MSSPPLLDRSRLRALAEQHQGENVTLIGPAAILSLLDAADERDRLAARVERLEQALEMATAGQQALAEHVNVLRKLADIFKDERDEYQRNAIVAAAALKGSNP